MSSKNQIMHRLLTLAVLVFSAGSQALASDASQCPLNVAAYHEKAKALAASTAGATLNRKTYEVSWNDEQLGRVSVLIGGCNHLGFSAKLERKSEKRILHQQAIELASHLVNQLWPKTQASQIAAALPRLQRNDIGSSVSLYTSVDIDGYDEVNLSYSYSRGILKIEVSAIQTV
jgi:opacity protein-like surface antigen